MGAQINRRGKKDEAQMMALYMRGCTDAEIGRNCGLSSKSVAAWRRVHDFTANFGDREKSGSMAELSKDAMAARELGMSYGQFKAMQYVGRIEAKKRQNAIFSARRKAKAEREAEAARVAQLNISYGDPFQPY